MSEALPEIERSYRARPAGSLVVAALLVAIGLGGFLLGEFGSAGADTTKRGIGAAAGAALDAMPLIWQYGLAYGFLICLLGLAALIAVRAFAGKPALVLSRTGVATNSLFASRFIAWDEIETVDEGVKGFVTLRGRGKALPVALDMMVQPKGEIMGIITAALAARGGAAARR